MKNTNQPNKYIFFGIMILVLIFGIFVFMPARAQAGFEWGQIIDPFCWFACDDAIEPAQIIDPFCLFACDDDDPNNDVYETNNNPPAPQAPTVTFYADNLNINYNDNTTLHWYSTDATSCSASGGTNGWSGNKNTSGTFYTGALTNTISFYINCTNSAGWAANDSVTVNVGTQVQNPTVSISANPSSINYNESSTITWNSNNATSCSASGGTNGWSGNKNTSGTFYTGALTNTISFYINCTNSAGWAANDSVTVNVGNQVQTCQDPSATNYGGTLPCRYPVQTCQDPSATNYGGALPCRYPVQTCQDNFAINYGGTLPCRYQNNDQLPTVTLRADDTNIDFEDDTTLRWSSDNATRCEASGGTNGWSDNNIGTHGTFNTGSLDRDETYHITCRNSDGYTDNDSITIRVNDDDNNNNNDEPGITTRSATNVNTSGASLNGRVDGNGSSVRAWFEYGTNTNLGYSTSRSSYGSGSTNYNKNVSGLIPNTIYYFRAVAENSQDTTYGNILSFSTGTDSTYYPPVNNQPTVVIYADQTNLAFNATTNIRWNTTNATSCFANGGSVGWAGAKNIGSGSFHTGLLTTSRTYTITCSNNTGSSSTDSVTVNVRGQIITTTINNPRPDPTSLVLITSSMNSNQPIAPTIDNTRPHPGDEINYTVNYQNVGTGAITNLTLQTPLPQGVDYISSSGINPTIFGNTLVFNLGKFQANGQGSTTIKMRVQENTLAGTILNFPATLSYVDPAGEPQSVNANVSAQVWGTPENEDLAVPLEASAIGSGSFLPQNLFGWLLLLVLMLILLLLSKHLYSNLALKKEEIPQEHI